MSQEALAAFLKKVQQDATLRRELVAFAAQRGYEFSTDELSDADLAELAGGITYAGTNGESSDKDHQMWTDVLSITKDTNPDLLP